ncbi:MAG TPA: metallophosphoesterase [Baekduia sp.]|uniref:metallophosphoesterase family protein n=1 Tax=Baekduia sp. TaxID=2600305 RepID=UPI002C7D6AA2|nr:metallophosphoesterase [Baekduia sp.]HMJ36007.1 metallophosphoesterase [Baekduia sp.]
MSGRRNSTRRELLATASSAAAAALLAGCGGGAGSAAPGSTLLRTLVDPDGDGLLHGGPGLPLTDRTDLAPRAAPGRVLAAVAQVSDLHVRDAQSPGRVAFLDRLGPDLGAAFRWHETLTAQVVAATVEAVNGARPQAVLLTGDLVDSAQRNELAWALALLRGGTVRPDSGRRGYQGVQAASIPDPLYYRPGVDAPRHPELLHRAVGPVRSPGLHAPFHPVLGNHDILVAGEIAPTTATRAAATGDRLLVTPSPDLLRALRGARPTRAQVDELLAAGLDGDAIRVAPDPARTQLDAAEVVARLRRGSTGRLDYAFDVGDALRVIVLDLVRRDAGSGGLVTAGTLAALQRELAAAGDRYILVAVHQPLHATAGGDAILDVLDADPRIVGVLAGHTHRNAIAARRSRAGGYWLITTASIVDWPQQWRSLRLVETRGGGVALETWMVDHTGRPNDEGSLAGIARDLSFLDPQGGRPNHAAGPPSTRNVRLHLPARRPRAPRRPGVPRALPPETAPERLGVGDTVAARA